MMPPVAFSSIRELTVSVWSNFTVRKLQKVKLYSRKWNADGMVWPFFLYRPFNPYPKAKQRDLIWNTFIWTLVSLLPNDSRSCQQITTRFSSSSSPHWRTNAPKGTWFDDFNNETVKLILMKYVFKFRMEAMHVTYGLRNDFPFFLFWMWR